MTAPVAAPAVTQRPKPERCDACHSHATGLVHAKIEDHYVAMCPNPTGCIVRAKAAGIWLVYPR